jgi:hypothetical protein
MQKYNFKSGMDLRTDIMKIFFLFTVLVFCHQSLYPQCKLVRSKDDFSESQITHSNDVTLASVFPLIGSKKPWEITMQFRITDSTYTIVVTHASQSYSAALQSIFFKFTDGTVLKKETSNGSGEYESGFGYKYTFTIFLVTKEELLRFSQTDVSKFQATFTYFPDYPVVEQEVKKKNIEKIRTDASCILSEIAIISTAKKEVKVEIPYEYECKYETNKIDDFTKKRTVITLPAVFFDLKLANNHGSTFFQVSGSNLNGINGLKFYRCINVNTMGGTASISEANARTTMIFDQVDLLLENDEVVSLKENEASDFVYRVSPIWSFKLYTINNYSIWKKLKTIPLKKIRVSMAGKELFTNEMDKKYAKSIIKVIDCIDTLGITKPK